MKKTSLLSHSLVLTEAATQKKHFIAGAVLFFTVSLLAACGSSDNARLEPRELFVCNLYHVSIFDASMSGNVSPLKVFAQTTEPSGLSGMTVDVINDEIFVLARDSITVYARSPNGDIVPLRKISGDSTALVASGIAVNNSSNEIFVTNFSNNSITVYARSANGNVPPLRTIAGVATALDGPRAITVDVANNEILVTNSNARITVFAGTANGNAAPLRTISFPGPAEFGGIALDSLNNEVLVTRFTIIDRYHFSTSVVVYERTAEGEAVPLRTISGDPAGVLGPMIGIAVDSAKNELFVSYESSNSVAVYERTANGDIAPLRVILGDTTGLKAPKVLAMGAL
jgi:DNA-binding beta-propeller fold protein YncE